MGMRTTNTMLVNNMSSYISTNLERMQKYQYMIANGKKIDLPSDDPVVASRSMKFRTDLSQIEQYQKNVGDGISWVENTDGVLENIGDVLQRVRELTVRGANSTMVSEDRQKINSEIEQLKKQLVSIGNATYAGRYIFSGYSTNNKLLNDDGSFAVSVSKDEITKYEVGISDKVEINVLGGNLFNNEGEAVDGSVGTMFEDMNKLIQAFKDDDINTIGNMLKNIDNNINNVLRVRADVGARTNRLELTDNRLSRDITNFTRLLSDNEDVDMAQTIMELQNEENIYRASLAGGAKIIMPSLVDYLS